MIDHNAFWRDLEAARATARPSEVHMHADTARKLGLKEEDFEVEVLDAEEGTAVGAVRDLQWAWREAWRSLLLSFPLGRLFLRWSGALEPEPRPKHTRCTDPSCYMAAVEHGPPGHL